MLVCYSKCHEGVHFPIFRSQAVVTGGLEQDAAFHLIGMCNFSYPCSKILKKKKTFFCWIKLKKNCL